MHSQQIKIILLCFSFCLLDSQTGKNAGKKEKKDFREFQLGGDQHLQKCFWELWEQEGCQAMEDAFWANCSQDFSLFLSLHLPGTSSRRGDLILADPASTQPSNFYFSSKGNWAPPPAPCTDASEYFPLPLGFLGRGRKEMYDFTVRFMKNVANRPQLPTPASINGFQPLPLDFSLDQSFARFHAQHCYTGGRDVFNCQRLH